jgi:hypothetical protein
MARTEVRGEQIRDGSIKDVDIAPDAAISDSKLGTISTAGKVSNSATTATNANTANAIVARDESGNFSAGTISATLSGNAATASNLKVGAGGWGWVYQTGAQSTATLAMGGGNTVPFQGNLNEAPVLVSAVNTNTAYAIARRDNTGSCNFNEINAESGVNTHSGSQALPGYRFTGDDNTGIFLPAADTLALSVGGLEKVRLTTTGLGVFTGSPQVALDVKGSLRLNGSASGYVGFSPAADAGSTTYTLPSADGSAGQVLSTDASGGLSWITPSAAVTFPLLASAGTSSLPSYSFTGDANTGMYLAAADTVGLSTAGAERLRIDSSGYVGIGTGATTLTKSLTVAGAVSINTNAGMFLGRFTDSQEATLASSLGLGDGGAVWFNTDDSQFKGWNGIKIVVLG